MGSGRISGTWFWTCQIQRMCHIGILNKNPLIFINKNISTEINGIENRKLIEKNQQNQNQLFEKTNIFNKPLARLTGGRERREDKLLISKMKAGTSLQIQWALEG